MNLTLQCFGDTSQLKTSPGHQDWIFNWSSIFFGESRIKGIGPESGFGKYESKYLNMIFFMTIHNCFNFLSCLYFIFIRIWNNKGFRFSFRIFLSTEKVVLYVSSWQSTQSIQIVTCLWLFETENILSVIRSFFRQSQRDLIKSTHCICKAYDIWIQNLDTKCPKLGFQLTWNYQSREKFPKRKKLASAQTDKSRKWQPASSNWIMSLLQGIENCWPNWDVLA